MCGCFFFFFFRSYNLGFFSVVCGFCFGFSPLSTTKVTKDMIGEASGSDLILPSEEVWNSSVSVGVVVLGDEALMGSR